MEAREAALNLIQYSTERVVDLVGWPSPLGLCPYCCSSRKVFFCLRVTGDLPGTVPNEAGDHPIGAGYRELAPLAGGGSLETPLRAAPMRPPQV
jgi:hypothetical protein